MADIAPLGFSVDTKPLADASDQADTTAKSLMGVADAADKVSDSVAKAGDKAKDSAEGAKKLAEAHKDAAGAMKQTAEQAKQNADNQAAWAAKVAASKDPLTAYKAELLLTNKEMVGYVSTHDKLMAAQAKTGASTNSLEKDLKLIATTLDPTVTKMLKLGEAIKANERLLASGGVGLKQYRENAKALYDELNRLQNAPLPGEAKGHGPNGSQRHNSFLGEIGRAFTYGIPRFGREARHLVYSAENEASGGTLGGGIMGFGKLALGAGVGMIGAEALQMVMKLPAEMAKAEDEAERLKRQLSSLDAGSLEHVEEMASDMSVSLKGAANAMMDFHGAMMRVQADAATQDKVFTSVLAAGRIGGLDENARFASAKTVASLSNKPQVSGSDIFDLSSSNPELAKAAATGMGTDVKGLQLLASTGQLSGKQLFDALVKMNTVLEEQNAKLPANAEEMRQKTKDAWEKVEASIGDPIPDFFRSLGLKIAHGIAYLTSSGNGLPDGARVGSVTTKVPEAVSPGAKALADAGPLIEKYGSYQTGQRGMSADLKLANDAIAAGEKNWKTLTASEKQSVETFKEYRREIQAGMAEQQTPFKQLTDQVNDLSEAMGHGSGGLIDVWTQALGVQREQERIGHGVVGTLDEIVQRLIRIRQLEAERDLGSKIGEAGIVQNQLDTLTQQGGGGDQLRMQADTEAATYAFQKFGDAVNQNTDFVKRYADALYRLKLLQRDLADEATAYSTSAQASDLHDTANMRMDGASESQIQQFTVQRAAERMAAQKTQQGASAQQGVTIPGTAATPSGPLNLSAGVIAGERTPDGRRSNKGAWGQMQVLDSTAQKPGYGVTPARNDTMAEYNRVGADYIKALNQLYGDPKKAFAAYNAGVGNVNKAVHSGGDEWLSHMSKDVQQYVDRAMKAAGGGTGTPGTPSVTTPGQAAIPAGLSPAAKAQIEAATFLQNEQFRSSASQRIAGVNNESNNAQGIYQDEYSKEAVNTGLLAATAQNDKLRIQAAQLELRVQEARRAAPEDLKGAAEAAERRKSAAEVELKEAQLHGAHHDEQQQMQQAYKMMLLSSDQARIQNRLYQERQKMLDANIDANSTIGQQLLAQAEALERQGIAFDKVAAKMAGVRDGIHTLTSDIGDAWANMFGEMERHGKLKVKTLLRGIEDGFYGMLDHVQKSLIIDPLMNTVEQKLQGAAGGLFGKIFGKALPGANKASGAGASDSMEGLATAANDAAAALEGLAGGVGGGDEFTKLLTNFDDLGDGINAATGCFGKAGSTVFDWSNELGGTIPKLGTFGNGLLGLLEKITGIGGGGGGGLLESFAKNLLGSIGGSSLSGMMNFSGAGSATAGSFDFSGQSFNSSSMMDFSGYGGGSANGNAFGPMGVIPFATGGIVNTPTRMGNMGLAGEGPGLYEGILPLRRGPDGKLGVSAHGGGGGGGGNTTVVVNDYRGTQAEPVEVQQRDTGDGTRTIQVTLRDTQRSNLRGGQVDADMSASYGIRRPAQRR
jgi:hypothetical protein